MTEIETKVREHLNKALKDTEELIARLEDMEVNRRCYQRKYWNSETQSLKEQIKHRIRDGVIAASNEIENTDDVPRDSFIILSVLYAMSIIKNEKGV